jgi:crotonobetainyl-CoA:carnitine CoA-transferase CaiB-like acyl-CoA transferase
VVEVATLFAGPLAATLLSDFGAEVIKLEHPRRADGARTHGPSANGVGLWWKTIGRNKRMATADLSTPEGAEILRRLTVEADVLIENFRPGTLERWGLGPDELRAVNPRLVLARVTGFGQFGPSAHRPGFGTLAEAMSGFAALVGEPGGPPALPPFGLADGVAALATALAVLTALQARERTGRGDVVDLAIIEPILFMLGAQITAYEQIGYVQPRMGNRSVNNAPRNTYRSSDGTWLVVSTSAGAVAERLMRLVGRPDLVEQEWFATGHGRAAHADELDGAVQAWIAAHSSAEVIEQFDRADAAVAPVQDVRGVLADPQYRALGTVTRVADPDFGQVAMQNVLFRLAENPGIIRWAGRAHGADTDAVLRELGYPRDRIADLRQRGVV